MSEFLRAKEGFFLPSERVVVKGGQVLPAGHPFVAGREHLFEPVDTGIEQATRTPGEMRIGTPRRDAVVASVEKPAKPAKPAARKARASEQAE